MSTNYKCVCGKLCSSQPGLTLHQKSCEKAQEAKEAGQPNVNTEDESGDPIRHHKEIQKFIAIVNEMAMDADRCLNEKNKSAGRRARKSLNEIRKLIKPLRVSILESMK